jgi:protein NRD1
VQNLTAQAQTLTAQNKDTEVVTTFYRVNAALPPASPGRISSLYVFDAIARAARKDADREKEKGKAREGRGMTGLISKMEGVADAWVGGMVDDGKGGVWAEGKVSFWVYSSTCYNHGL